MKNKDSILAWSGGVESTAVLIDCLEKGMNPLCFQLTINGNWKGQIDAVNKMTNILGIDDVVFIEHNNIQTISNLDLTKSHYKNAGGFVPLFIHWSTAAHILQMYNPHIKRILYGFNKGLISEDDGMGDNYTDSVSRHFSHIEKSCSDFGIETKMYSPLGHLTKLEQWKIIPKELRPHVHVCMRQTPNPCGNCIKCQEYQLLRESENSS